MGLGGRGGMNEVLKDGIKQYWAAFGSLPGFKTSSVLLAIRALDDTEFAEQFKSCAVPAETTAEQPGEKGGPRRSDAPNPLKARVMYPSVDAKIFPELGRRTAKPDSEQDERDDIDNDSVANFDDDVKYQVTSRFLSNGVTHVIFVQNTQLKDALRLKLQKLATRATIFANGKMDLITPGVEGKILSEAMAGVPIICLHNTGAAAEALGAAVLLRRQPNLKVFDESKFPKEEIIYNYSLPENVPDDQFLILNPAKDSVEKVINKLTLVLSSVQDAEMMEVGYHRAEQTRIMYAWELYALFRHNAKRFRLRARILHYILVMISLAVTFISVVSVGVDHAARDCYFDDEMNILGFDLLPFASDNRGHLELALIVLPVFNAFFLTVVSRFNPLGKWVHLESGAVKVRSEIYRYRARVVDYMPRATANVDIEERVEELCDTPDPLQGMVSVKKKQKKEAAAFARPVISRRAIFSHQLEKYNSDAIGSDLRSDTLEAPTFSEIKAVQESLYDSRRTAEAFRTHQFWQQGLCQGFMNMVCCCCRRNPASHSNYTDMHVQEEMWDEWGTDYMGNPNVLEDDYLRDDGVQVITAEDYNHFRLLPLIHHYNRRSVRLTTLATRAQISIFFLTGLMSTASMLGSARWVPVLVAGMTAISSTMEFENIYTQLRNVNQSLQVLKNLRIWWQSLSMVERRMPHNKEILVAGTEATADSEISSWMKTLSPPKGSTVGDNEDPHPDEGLV
jgi:hypothetical protein